ncbi:MAG TPA: hypothetical protein VJP45_06110 [Candidatus Limnocylindria bacterium]|nr:hypothetical protein [Candidatus Limnocylindria bacterium]
MTREYSAILRFILMCAAWAVGQTLTWGLQLDGLAVIVPAALAVGVLVVTQDLGRPRASGGNVMYYRGRRIDRDRWN